MPTTTKTFSNPKSDGLSNFLGPITALFNAVSSLLSFSLADDRVYPSSNLAVSIQKGGLSIAYAKRFLGKVKVSKLRHIALKGEEYPKPSEVVSTIQSTLSEFGIKPQNLTLSVPSDWVVFRKATFPVAVKENLSTVVGYELDRLTPFGSDEAYYDYVVLSEDRDHIHIALIASKASVIKPYIDELKTSDISVTSITSNLITAQNILRDNGSEDGFLFVELKPSVVQVVHVVKGTIRAVLKSPIDYSNTQSAVDALIGMMGQCSNGKRPLAIIHSQGNPKDALIESLKAKSPYVLKTSEQYLNQMGVKEPLALHAVGAAFETLKPDRTKSFDLLSKGKKTTKKRPYVLTGLLIVLLLIQIVLYLLSPIYIEQKRIESLTGLLETKKEDLKKSEELKRSIESVKEEIARIEGFTRETSDTLNIMRELTNLLPKTAWLTRVRIAPKVVEIEGYAENTSGLLTKLEESKYFMSVEFSSPSYRDMHFKAERFSIKMQREDRQDEKK